MRHLKSGRKFSRTTDHRKWLMRNLATSLLESGRITTTEAKAKELRRHVDRLITAAKPDDLAQRMRPGVGPPCPVYGDPLPGQLLQRPFQLTFDGAPRGLLLPARKAGAVVLQHDLDIHFSNPGDERRLFVRSEEHTSELQSRQYLVCRLLLQLVSLQISGR